MYRAGAAALLALLVAACAPLAPVPAYRNPVLDRDFPDPAALRAPDGWVYAYATQSAVGGRMVNIQVARSRNLVQWEHLGDALPEKPRWGATKQRFWAPHVIYDNAQKKYFMYYSAEPDADKGTCLAVATAGAPQGPFSDIGAPLLCGAGIEHIDPMAFDDPRTGKRLLYWGSGGKPIRVQELAPDRLRFLPGSSPTPLLHPDPSRPYRRLIEGAWVLHHDGSYYLFYSGDRCCSRNPRYAVMVARGASAFGPFEERRAPILEADSTWVAPGHNSVVSSADGRSWILYHAIRATRLRDEGEQRAHPRLLLLDRLELGGGWPAVERDEPSGDRAFVARSP